MDNLRKTSKSSYIANHPKISKVVVGAVILDRRGRILLLQRATHKFIYPDMYKIPGGQVQDKDANLKDDLYCEVKEETDLDITRVLMEMNPLTYTTSKGSVTKQLNFLVEVESCDFKVNPNKHSTGMWALKQDMVSLHMTEEMRVLVNSMFEEIRKTNAQH